MNESDKIDKAVDLISKYGGSDDAHHKQWILDQTLRILMGKVVYSKWLKVYCSGEDGPDTYEWDKGIAP